MMLHAPRIVVPMCMLLCLIASGLGGCTSAGIAMRESFGIAKREQLVDRVKEARDSQNEAKEQFDSALAEFIAVTGQTGKGGELEAKYKKLSKEYDRSKSAAAAVTKRIDSVEAVADKLFAEWEKELGQYSSATLRAQSEQQLAVTRQRYEKLLGAMRAAESKMQPVLSAFGDQVLFLKHNLNAQAIASLQGTVSEIQNDVSGLIREMEASIAEANAFIAEMDRGA